MLNMQPDTWADLESLCQKVNIHKLYDGNLIGWQYKWVSHSKTQLEFISAQMLFS